MTDIGLDIEEMKLAPVAREAALVLKQALPQVIFTSGRRSRRAQAQAMAVNVVQKRDWIRLTYLHAGELQTWIDLHPEAVTTEQLTAGLYECLLGMSDKDLVLLTAHLSGDAWDVMPLLTPALEPTDEGRVVIASIRVLPGLERFLTMEGGLHRWHAQFTRSVEI